MLLTALWLFALAARTSAALSNTASPYRKIQEYSGSSFFDGFDAYHGPDPTFGYVDYVDMTTAALHNLTAFIWNEETESSNAFIGVDDQQLDTVATGGRMSVRLRSRDVFNIGLLTVFDIVHAPSAPGVWPAIWLLANETEVTWPTDGEMDILEWVNDATYNAMTLHTAPGCVVDRTPTSYQGHLRETDCSSGNGDLGCSIDAPSFIPTNGTELATAGAALNAQGGGVYVHEWTGMGVTEWLFARGQLPLDLQSEQPDPTTWAARPLARWTGAGCQFGEAFQHQQLIINVDLCGDWAGQVWNSSGMAQKTGVASCNEYVANQPEAFKDGFFEFASIKVYSSSAETPASVALNDTNRNVSNEDDGCCGGSSKSNTSLHACSHLRRHVHACHHRHQHMLPNSTYTPPLPLTKLSIFAATSGASSLKMAEWMAATFLLLAVGVLI